MLPEGELMREWEPEEKCWIGRVHLQSFVEFSLTISFIRSWATEIASIMSLHELNTIDGNHQYTSG
jgi:hypothetical protein